MMAAGDGWILDIHPHPDAAGVPVDTLISIQFAQDMNRHTLNARNILILDGNEGGRLISDRFAFAYNPEVKRLLIYFKESAAGFGRRNRIEIIVTGRIANQRNESMGVPVQFWFTTA